jgi:asparagine synthase (glutamine-hydrolysing)
MCGFSGFYGSFHGDDDDAMKTLRHMGAEIVHRGPDHEGVVWLATAQLGLVHRRLSVIDVSEYGHQPMWSACRRYLIAYNGEVYNFETIRRDLEKLGNRFVGHSDTEVILAAISEWGLEPALVRFVGMFAFVLWDAERREITLVRDRLGIKPLYYTLTSQNCLFGSELKPLRHFPGWRGDVDRDALADFLDLGYVPAPATIYQNVCKLPPGHLLRVRFAEGGIRTAGPVPYWSLQEVVNRENPDTTRSESDVLEGFRDQLIEAVKIRMIADVPLGAFLSGGLDSSIVVAIMQMESSRPVKTFSIGVRNQDYNEAGHAAKIAQYLGTEHTERYVEEEDLVELVSGLPRFFDEPFADSSQLPTLLLARITKEAVTVALSGDGGDELFAGYNRHIQAEQINRLRTRLPSVVRNSLSGLLRSIPAASWDRMYNAASWAIPRRRAMSLPGEKAHIYAKLLRADSREGIYGLALSQWNRKPPVVGGECGKSAYWWQLPTRSLSVTEEFMYRDTLGYLHDDILTKVDRCTMAVSLELQHSS